MLVDIRARIRWIAPLCRPVVMVDFKAFVKRFLHLVLDFLGGGVPGLPRRPPDGIRRWMGLQMQSLRTCLVAPRSALRLWQVTANGNSDEMDIALQIKAAPFALKFSQEVED